MDLLLTDDEIVAATFERRLAWPVPFPTVVTDVDHLAAAATRGRRSLQVRGLATLTATGVEIAVDIVNSLERAIASHSVMAWVASIDDPARLAGSSTVIFRQPHGDLLDLTSANGIHNLRSITAKASDEIVIALAKNVFDFGFAGGALSTTRLIVGEFGVGQVLLVSAGKTESGSWAEHGIEAHGESTSWSSALVQEALR